MSHDGAFEQRRQFTFIWKIDNFNFNPLEPGGCFQSPVFEPQDFNGTSWFLEFYPRGLEHDCYSSCFLCRTASGVEEIRITFKIELMGDDGRCLESRELINSTLLKEAVEGWEKYFNNMDNSNLTTISICCSMFLLESIMGLSTILKARSVILVDRYCFRWNVKKSNDSSWTERKIFSCSPSLFIEVIITAPNDTMDICITRTKNVDEDSHYIECKLSLLDVTRVERNSTTYARYFCSDKTLDDWRFSSFITISKLISEKSKYIKDGTFCLNFEFSVSDGKTRDEIFYEEPVNKYVCAEVDTITTLQENLLRMYVRQLQADVSLRAENQTFRAHKSLLSARSPVFAAMFEQDMLENKTGVVDIPDVEAKILSSFLEFAYTGIVDNLNCASALKLLMVADKYQVSSLMEKCSLFLMSNLTTENASDIVIIADEVGHEVLKAHTVDYIMTHASAILSSDRWARCIQSNIKLATEIICKLSTKLGSQFEIDGILKDSGPYSRMEQKKTSLAPELKAMLAQNKNKL